MLGRGMLVTAVECRAGDVSDGGGVSGGGCW